MNIGALISSIATDIYFMGIGIINTAYQIQGVYLIGGALSGLLANVGGVVAGVGARLGVSASQIDQFVNMVLERLGDNPILQRLLDYANRIIAFIDDPFPTIQNVVRHIYPLIEQFIANPLGFLQPYVTSIINSVFSFLRDMRGFIKLVMGEVIKDFSLLVANPTLWIFNQLRKYSSGIAALLLDPDGYIVERVKARFPDVWRFVQDPRGYLFEKFVEGLETLTEKFLPRILKVIERTINQIF